MNISFRKRATDHDALLQKMTYKDEASYGYKVLDACVYVYVCVFVCVCVGVHIDNVSMYTGCMYVHVNKHMCACQCICIYDLSVYVYNVSMCR